MKPEHLKVIAEGMGYQTTIDKHYRTKEKILNYYKDGVWAGVYSSITNNDQMVEIMVKCGISIYVDSTGDGRYATVWDSDIYLYELYDMPSNDKGFYEYEATMIRRLVCNVAYEYFKGNK
ncbi:MAG: hypothetical protein E3J23_03010 [Candidatus Stahlbacteria bacterium]|nr:MAG: hypothetical protein E3J23_03010 [Candidatus Stahlbacteria bacterium]